MEYVVPEYFIVNKNNSYECRPDYLNEIKPSVISYLKFRRRESGDSSLKNPLGENNNISLNTGEQTDTDSGVTLTHQDYLEYFNKTSLGNTDRTSLLLYNKLIYCMKHKLFDEASATLPMIKPDFGYPAKYLDLCHAIIGSVNNNYANAENTLNTLIGKEEYNRYYIVNMGLLQRKNKKIMSAVKYLIMGYELLSSSNWRYELKLYIAELNEKFIAIGPGIVKGAYSISTIKKQKTQKSFVESAALMKKTYTSDDEYIIAQAKKQINRIYDYLCTEAEALFAANKFRQANELYLMAYQVDKNITIIRKILSVFDYYTPDQKELELRAGLRRELTEMENEFRNTSNLRKTKSAKKT
ncbi:hypothetical protein CHS0354_006899 [Potamilus streckersoni]|uniref:Uncharacterized protein n=1 Tax=Potamilus streckersoni TaxID=2493646 RepID=A0AAE0TFQ1_9BIVA|nr:hypothetical protein CHS0354_006899 [Potamilus streckersoni]